MNTMTNLISGVADAGTRSMSWTFHAAFAAPAKRSAHAAIPQRKRRAAAAPVASVKWGTI